MLENKSKHWIEKIKRTRDEKDKIDIKCRLTHEKQIEIRCRHLKKDNIIKALPWNKTPSRNRDSLKDDSRHKEEMRIRAGSKGFLRTRWDDITGENDDRCQTIQHTTWTEWRQEEWWKTLSILRSLYLYAAVKTQIAFGVRCLWLSKRAFR